ncbi:unnamed protein product [Penicillium egyptiacum]|uniref:Uncharacterized protein n=1 Tax=Penicillium egyptiacum TaxID=1303716 RepID=A0A9W4KGW4_9EURO|nr:unnamed protein product [Penicillium egyptiacum]
MPRTPSSIKRFVNRFRRATDSRNDEEVPPPPTQSSAVSATAPAEAPATPTFQGAKRKRGGNDGADDDDRPPTESSSSWVPGLARARGIYKRRKSSGISTDLNLLPGTPSPESTEQVPGADRPELPATPRNLRMYAGKFSATVNTDRIHIPQPTPPRNEITRFRRRGLQFENWMANTNQSGAASGVAPSTQRLRPLVEASPPNEPLFNVWRTSYGGPPAEIRESLKSTNLPQNARGQHYRHSSLIRDKVIDVSSYVHYIVEGAIIAQEIFRKEGPYWSDIALALYKHDAQIDTLRYVFMLHVENDETIALVGKVLYRQHRLPGPENRATTPEIHTWRMRTADFERILGTQLGRAVSRLVLAAWPVGTHHIPRIHTWFLSSHLHMRFDIERIG